MKSSISRSAAGRRWPSGTILVGALFRAVKSAASRMCDARNSAGFVPTTSVTD